MENKFDTVTFNKIINDIENGRITTENGVLKIFSEFSDDIKTATIQLLATKIGLTKSSIAKLRDKYLNVYNSTNINSDENITATEFVCEWLETNNYEVDIKGNLIKQSNKNHSKMNDEIKSIMGAENVLMANENFMSCITRMTNDARNRNLLKNVGGKEGLIDNTILHIRDTRLQLAMEAISKNIILANGETYGTIENFIPLAELITDDDSTYVATVLYHFVWQVKRKMTGGSVDHQMMPILTGKQGTGKSSFIHDHLLAPLEGLHEIGRFKTIEEGKNVDIYTNNFVLFFDEMVGASKTENNIIKSLITNKTVEYRPMGTNTSRTVSNNITCIGATNETLADLIRDPTGARRFPQFTYGRNGKYPCSREDLQNFDFHKLWRSVNAQAECIFDTNPELHELVMSHIKQDAYISPFEEWALHYDGDKPLSFSTKTSATNTSRALYIKYSQYISDYYPASRPINLKKFQNDILKLSEENNIITNKTYSKQSHYFWDIHNGQ